MGQQTKLIVLCLNESIGIKTEPHVIWSCRLGTSQTFLTKSIKWRRSFLSYNVEKNILNKWRSQLVTKPMASFHCNAFFFEKFSKPIDCKILASFGARWHIFAATSKSLEIKINLSLDVNSFGKHPYWQRLSFPVVSPPSLHDSQCRHGVCIYCSEWLFWNLNERCPLWPFNTRSRTIAHIKQSFNRGLFKLLDCAP